MTENKKDRREREELNQILKAFKNGQEKQIELLDKISAKLTNAGNSKETSKNAELVDHSDKGGVQFDKSKFKEQISNTVKECLDELNKTNSSDSNEALAKKLESAVKLQMVDGGRET